MKTISAFILLGLAACNGVSKTNSLQMPGAYKMLSQSLKSNTVDTTYRNLSQLKIYTDDYMMYANFNPSDSVSSFGIGEYSTKMDSVTENVIYNASDTLKSDTATSFVLGIEKTDKGYRQVIADIPAQGNHFRLTEEYETVGTAVKSPLDGTWKLVSMYSVKGKDTTHEKIMQFKTYGSGYFIFGHTYSDSANRTHSGTGYGSFAMTGNNKSKESVIASTYPSIRGQNIDIDITLNGTDTYTQAYSSADGTRNIEVYQRLRNK